ncbi:MAG: hypothetical protein WKF57_00195 [Nakamurella sp.]
MSKPAGYVVIGVLFLLGGLGIGLRPLSVNAADVRDDGTVGVVVPLLPVVCGSAWSSAVPRAGSDPSLRQTADDCRDAVSDGQYFAAQLLGYGAAFVLLSLRSVRQERRRQREESQDWADRIRGRSVTGGMNAWRTDASSIEEAAASRRDGAAPLDRVG